MSAHVMKFVGTMASVLGLVQGLIWIIFCILGILVYNCEIVVTPTTGISFIEVFVQIYFIGGSICGSSTTEISVFPGVTAPDDMLIWLCVYLSFSVLWVIASITWLVDLHREGRPPVSMYLWCGTTGLILILDLAATIWFGTDLSSVKSLPLGSSMILLPAVLSTALMMTMAARGFILYLVNAGLLLFVTMTAVKNLKKKPVARTTMLRNSFVNPAMNTTFPDKDESSATLKDSWEPRAMPRYPTFITPPMSPVYDDMPPRSQPPMYLQDPPRGRSSPPVPLPKPKYTIPDPDYSPVMSRAYPQPMLPLRPALKKTQPYDVGRTVF